MQLSQVLKTWRVSGSSILVEFFGGIIANGPVTSSVVFPTYGPSIVIDAALGSNQIILVTNATAFTVVAPTHPPGTGVTQDLTITIQNPSAGSVGTITWDAGATGYRLAGAFTNPATLKQRSIIFRYNQTNGNWQEIARTAADVTNI